MTILTGIGLVLTGLRGMLEFVTTPGGTVWVPVAIGLCGALGCAAGGVTVGAAIVRQQTEASRLI